MKKIIFCLFFIISFGILINQNHNQNIKHLNYNNNFHIQIPNNINNSTINNYITNFTNNYDYLFIDYDFTNNTNLTMYIYKENNNIVKSTSKNFTINNNTKTNYDFINQKIIADDKLIALTFDDGPNHNTTKILDILEKYDIVATFFVLGTNIGSNEKTIKRMHELGMEIGNHMYSHKIATKLSEEKLQEEINKTDKLVYDIIHKYPTLIRPSYGIYNNKIKKIIKRPIILWNIDTLDWKYHDSKKIANKVFNNLNRGNIILMHDIYSATANSLEIIIPKLLSEGFKFVTVSDLLYYETSSK